MGQYYNAIILGPNNIIRTWLHPHAYNNGAKLTEHSYIGNRFVSSVEWLLCPEGMFYKSPLVWAGDYADKEVGSKVNLHDLVTEAKEWRVGTNDTTAYRYIVNHDKRLYVDKRLEFEDNIHPLPLLTAEGNGRGGGDYEGENMQLVGSWARDCISMEIDIPEGYEELVCEFGFGN